MPACSYLSRADDAPSPATPSAKRLSNAAPGSHAAPKRPMASWGRAVALLALAASASWARADPLASSNSLAEIPSLTPSGPIAVAPQAAGSASAAPPGATAAENADCRADPAALRAIPADSSDADKKRWLAQKPCLYTPARPAFARLNEFNIARPQSLALGDATGVSGKYELLQPNGLSADAPQ